MIFSQQTNQEMDTGILQVEPKKKPQPMRSTTLLKRENKWKRPNKRPR